MMRGMHKKLDEVLYENARIGQPISKLDLCKVDNNIVVVFHSNDVLEIIIEKTKPNIKIIHLLELMGEPFPRLMLDTLQ
jgi:hypothetical protein